MTDDKSVGEDAEALEPPLLLWECKTEHAESLSHSSKKLSIELPCDSTIPLLGIQSES